MDHDGFFFFLPLPLFSLLVNFFITFSSHSPPHFHITIPLRSGMAGEAWSVLPILVYSRFYCVAAEEALLLHGWVGLAC